MPDSFMIDMSEVRLTKELRYGCICLKNAHLLPLAETFIRRNANEPSITFWGDTPEPWDAVSLVSISMFRMPQGRKEFQRQIDFFGDKRKKRAKLPEGEMFDTTTLAIKSVSSAWEHDAFARSGRDFIHIYRGKKYALLMRLLGKAGGVLDNPLLKLVHNNLRLVDEQWIIEPPATEPRKAGKAKPRLKESPLNNETIDEINSAASQARKRFGLAHLRSPAKVAAGIGEAVDAERLRTKVTNDERIETAVGLGALFGDCLEREVDWEWCAIPTESGGPAYAVCSPNRSHMVTPMLKLLTLLKNKRKTNNLELMFNLIAADKLPPSQAGGYCHLD
jgi:hypothetical protein